ncbi:GNAT family N-acetyltransferase [Roseomonas sp. CCTCC AB2023176]|uniref:GNAT family N-acetyltransferase n=1 Tax=Roseomonas sp. CCTCC AB2023176 TaxID=3342640 RepID=UPI0035DC73A6
MRADDLLACEAIGEAVHAAHPEDEGRMAEKFRLFPAGCLVLREAAGILGYAISHPWRSGEALALNAALGRLPDAADTLYLHDLALLPEARGKGAGLDLAERVAALAATLGYATVSIVAVGGTLRFWERAGFRVVEVPALVRVLQTYDAAAAYMQRAVAPDRRRLVGRA